ncbi:gamma-glutamylaminecyclotransferase-like isoform X2 [Limulus polyphemus]|uniref:Gamma-glutamylcyclotransferase family protein n=1 Tax=Limulus polyphemus TaxID=6850 RepID=A0ABM1B5L3_LIMPO|nr:gamma-glutamylaminecyclotransferase-like isoform X2 [Limulus polyphemus]
MTSENRHLVFVYGTLKNGEPNFQWLCNPHHGSAKFLGKVKTKKRWPLVIASRYNVPYLLYCEEKGKNVIGEVYEVNDRMLEKLDELENHPTYYERKQEDVCIIQSTSFEGTATAGDCLRVWMYFLKNYKPELLNLPYHEDYSSKGPHGLEYMESDDSDPEDI